MGIAARVVIEEVWGQGLRGGWDVTITVVPVCASTHGHSHTSVPSRLPTVKTRVYEAYTDRPTLSYHTCSKRVGSTNRKNYIREVPFISETG